MLEIKEINGTRIGTYEFDGKLVCVPSLLSCDREQLQLGDVIIPKPLSYPFRDAIEDAAIRPNAYIRVGRGAPPKMANRSQKKNAEMALKGDVTQVFLSGYWDLDKEFIDSLQEARIFMFGADDERSLLKAFFTVRDKYPNSLCYCDCGPDLIPVLSYAGFDLFPDTPDNRKSLDAYMGNRSPEYVEMASCKSISAKTLLNLLYQEHWGELERYMSVPDKKELFISRDAFWRPHVQRWAELIVKDYTPISNTFLLLPCSSRKPYSSSQSHRKYISVIRSKLGSTYGSLCQLIVTSPYGVVPRELEGLIDYDIVVTGNWMEEEIERSNAMIKGIVSKVEDPIVIAHLPENEIDTVRGLDAEVIVTGCGHPLSEESISNLKKALDGVAGRLPDGTDRYSDLRALSRFMYGSDIFPSKIGIRGRTTKQVYSGGTIIASLGKRLRPMYSGANVSKNWVDIDFDIRGDLFCVGIKDADEGIRTGEDVVIRNGGDAVAVGTALLPGGLMKKMRKGKAVKVRKRF